MKIFNARLGFANNSSSSHSIVFMNDVSDDSVQNGEYGWDNFVLASETAKNGYLHGIIFENLMRSLPQAQAMIIANDLTGMTYSRDSYVYIDHQSQWVLPYDWGGGGIDMEFVEDLRDHLMRDDIVILGGNDNDDDHPLRSLSRHSPAQEIWREQDSTTIVARKDGSYWSIFNRDTGAKLRMSFNDSEEPYKASLPELVDLKITDYCPIGCDFCYQGSTIKGQHGDYNVIRSLLFMLKDWKVFEVAIGGGEPTFHPRFYAILKDAKDAGIVPNFTTKTLGWLKGPLGMKVLGEIGSFAYSVESASDVSELAEALEPAVLLDLRGKASVQYVVGIHDAPDVLVDIVRECKKHHITCTLLGYKNTHRGITFGEKKSDLLVKTIKKLQDDGSIYRLSIDTVLADRYYDELLNIGVSKWLLTRQDGAFSAYIDAVERTLSPHSFTGVAGQPLATTYSSTSFDYKKNAEIFRSF